MILLDLVKHLVGRCGCHGHIFVIDGFIAILAFLLYVLGQLVDYFPRGDLVHQLIGDIQLEVTDPVDIFVDLNSLLSLYPRYLLEFLQLGQHTQAWQR